VLGVLAETGHEGLATDRGSAALSVTALAVAP
jgi:hypothetical protein